MVDLKIREFGTGDRVLICLHGFLGEVADWNEFADSLLPLAAGWRLVAVALPGHDIEVPGWLCPDAVEFSKTLQNLAHSRGWGRTVIAGYSLGGRLGLHAALLFPSDFPYFVGISTTAGIDDPEERARRRHSDYAIAQRLRDAGGFPNFLREWWHQPVFNSPYRDSGKFEEFISSRLKQDPLQLAECLETWSPGVLPSQWSALSYYAGRVLLLSGECDTKYTAAAKRMHALFQDAALGSIAGAGHQLLIEKPCEVAHAVAEFLKQID